MQRLIKFGHELAAPLIETESYAMRRLNGGTLQKAYHFGHEFRRHPVRCEQAHVLEDMEHSTFARAGEAGEKVNGSLVFHVVLLSDRAAVPAGPGPAPIGA